MTTFKSVVINALACVCFQYMGYIKWHHLECSSMMGHGAANPLVTAVLLNVSDPLLTLTHDLCSLQVEVFVDHLQTHDTTLFNHREENRGSFYLI